MVSLIDVFYGNPYAIPDKFTYYIGQDDYAAKREALEGDLSECEVTKKVNGDGYNIVFNRQADDSNRTWAKRTSALAQQITSNLDGVTSSNKTFSSGRIHLGVEKDSIVDARLQRLCM
jgi:hypothetical protein